MTSTLKKVSRYAVFLLVLGACLWTQPMQVHAQDAVSYTVSPTIYDMTANPGQVFSSTLRIINTNSFELRVYIDVNNFIPKEEDGVPQFIPIDKSTSEQSTFAQWITSEKELVIAPEQAVELPFTITVPENAAPGGHFAALMVSTRPLVDDSNESRVQTAQSISSLLFMRVTGDITENSSVRSFRTSHYLLSKPEATFELRIENKGNVHLQPQGEIKIFNMWGKERGVIPVNQQTLFGNVLPNSVRKYAFTWFSEWSITDIGRYTAVATLAYGVDTRQFMTADTAFWIIPWKFLLTIIVVVGGFIALVTWAIKLYVRRMLTLAGVTPGARLAPQTPEPIIEVEKKTKKDVAKEPKETVKEKTKRMAAPIEAGILDLRSQLDQKNTFKGRLNALVQFVRQYWQFFSVTLAVIVFLILVVLFFKGAFASDRDYQVYIESQGKNITITPDATTNTTPSELQPVVASSTIVSVVNRSGDSALTEKVRSILQEHNYSIGSSTEEQSEPTEKTVIVYSAADAERAAELSKLLQNALLSAYADSESSSEIVIYIGKDLATAP